VSATTAGKDRAAAPKWRGPPGAANDIIALAVQLWGPQNVAQSTCEDFRFGTNGSKSVKPKQGIFFDHETGEGGGYRDLHRLANGNYPENGAIWSGFAAPPAKVRQLGEPVAWWDYHSAEGAVVARVVRFHPPGGGKTFRQCRPEGDAWVWKTQGVEIPLYRLPMLLRAPAGSTVYVTEGEKHADRLREWGLIATTSAMGAGKFLTRHARALAGRSVLVLGDNDGPGRKHVATVLAELRAAGVTATTLELPGLADKGDVLDWIEAGGTADELAALTAAAWGRRTSQDKPAEGPLDMLEHPDMSVLRLHRRSPPMLDLKVFGVRWAEWIATTAIASACPADYVAAPLLAVASVLIGNARWAEAWPGWAEPPHLWACGVGDSGSGKSPGSDVLLRDVVPTLERRMSGDYPEQLRAWAAASETDKAARERWEGEVREALRKKTPPPPPPKATARAKPEIPRLRQNDVTVEKVATLLATAAPKGLMIHRDEFLGWIASMNAYNEGGRPFWLESYGGRPFRMERQKHPDPIDIPHLVVAAFGGTQPAKIAGLLKDPDDGLLGRILWFWPDSVPFAKGRAAPGVPWAIDALDRLRQLDLEPATCDAPARPTFVPLHETLQTKMEAFGQEMQLRQQESGGLMQSAYGKARGLLLRLALVLTYLQWIGERPDAPPPAQITPAGFAAAAHLVADYLMPMAERVYGDAATTLQDRNAATLARWIVKLRASEVHVRHMQRKVKLPGLGDADSIHAAAAVLVEAGWLAPPKPGFGADRKVAYLVNRRVFEAAAL
jgi:hypothetical protein